MSLWGNGRVIFPRIMAKDVLLTNHSLLSLSPASALPLPRRTVSPPTRASLLKRGPGHIAALSIASSGPHFTQSQGQSPAGEAQMFCALCLKHCSPDVHWARSLISSLMPPASLGHSGPTLAHTCPPPPAAHLHPYFLHSPYHPLSHLVIVLTLCPLRKGRDFFVCFVPWWLQGW